ncbi:uncharacterized protein LOC127002187 [Eriocheir sinensis]|uniref:uncharacterized protein LOC127002187 n=1 Tax=Eriocheir sinensis TaxID=95602 RepID=UPI0021C9157D|nr:uncharacterized protein LOC127002187 [Eriocheir sinensis]
MSACLWKRSVKLWIETPLTTEPIPTDIMVDAPTSYHVVGEGSRKGGDLLTDSLGFQYVKKRVTSVSTSWICSIRTKKNRCFASVTQQGNIFTRGPKEHNHRGNPGAQLRAQAISVVKAAAREDLYKSSGKIVTDTLLTLATDKVQLPKVSNLQRTANRARQQLRPKHPTDLEFEIAIAHIPSDFLQQDIHHEGHRHLIFASPLQLSFLSKSKIWFIDRTFKDVREPFVQLVSIHSYIKFGDCTKQAPLLFVVMSRRKTTDYTAILDAIMELLPSNIMVEEIVVDFERALWSALHKSLPDVPVFGCWSHWAQAVYNRIKEYGLRPAYVHQLPFRNYIQDLMALPNLPASHINNAFYQLKDRCPQVQAAQAQKLHKLLNYLEETWITSASCPPSTWSTYKRVVRTNIEVEGWHHRLNHNSPTKRMNLYLLINTLYDETKLLSLQVRLIKQKKICRIQSKKTHSKQRGRKSK